MDSSIQQIKDKLDIVDFIRQYAVVQPAGKNFRALCPFHKEKTPSFIISPDRQTWHCFGSCSEGGDIFQFLMKYENLEFYEALKILAEKAGIELKKISPMDHKQFGVLYDINNSAKDFFKKQLEKSKEAEQYLKSRGLKKEIIEEFEIGFSSQEFDHLTVYLISLGYDIKDIERAGLNFKNERGGYLDRFRGRIMFPIYSHLGKAVAFSGRILPQFDNGEMGKYVNSSETPIFSKSKILYGFHKSKNFIREEKSAVLVEGQMDFLMCWQDGLKNIAATSGTALTLDHLTSLKRQTNNLIFCFDNDEAGFKAIERGIDMAQAADFNAKVLVLKDYKDPGEAAEKSPGIMLKLAKEAGPAMEFYFQKYNIIKGKQKDIGELKDNLRLVLGKIKNLASPIEQAHWLKELSYKIGIKEEALIEEMNKISLPVGGFGIKKSAVNKELIIKKIIQPSSRRDLIIYKLVKLVVIKNNLADHLSGYFDYFPVDYLEIIKSLIEKRNLEDETLANLLHSISMQSSLEHIAATGEEFIEAEFKELLRQLKKEHLKEEKERLAFGIKEAEKIGDEEKVLIILKELHEISKILEE
ncbi:MAG: DNA primase, partial [Patescibacteria group bacterium]